MTDQPAHAAITGRPKGVAALLVALAWLFVGVPIAWGVYSSGKRASLLFRAAPSAVKNDATKPAVKSTTAPHPPATVP